MCKNKISQFVDEYADNKLVRFFILVAAAVVGILLYRYCLDYIYCLLNAKKSTAVASTAIEGAVLGLLVFAALWWFRTRDARQNIEQTNLFNGLRLLASNNPLEIDIGVHQLLRLFKAVPKYEPDIRLAFIRRLKKSPIKSQKRKIKIKIKIKIKSKCKSKIGIHGVPKVHNIVPLAYAQHIFKWLMKKERCDDDSDYRNIDISHQDFSKPGLFIDIQNRYQEEFSGTNPNGQSAGKGWTIYSVGVPESELVKVKRCHCCICMREATSKQYRAI